MPGKRKKSSKGRKGRKGRKASEASKDRKARKARRGPKNDPITMAAREFLYECPGGMDENEKRDKFLAVAKRDEQAGEPLYNIVGNVVRAAFFQGKRYVDDHAADIVQKEARRKRGRKQGPLDAGDRHVLRSLVEEIGVCIAERLGVTSDDQDEHVTILMEHLSTLRNRFDCTDTEPELWKMELNQLAHDILNRVLERTQEKLEGLMGASAWKTMGLPQF